MRRFHEARFSFAVEFETDELLDDVPDLSRDFRERGRRIVGSLVEAQLAVHTTRIDQVDSFIGWLDLEPSLAGDEKRQGADRQAIGKARENLVVAHSG